MPDFSVIRSLLVEPVIIDGRNIYEPEKVQWSWLSGITLLADGA